MITVNDKNLCENCFMETDQEPCPFCSYGKKKRRDFSVLGMGSVLDGRYMIGGVIGKGGFGITYLAYDIKLEKRIAVKEYYPRGIASRAEDRATVSASDEKSEKTFRDGADKFYKEAELVSQFNGNPNIVNVYDFFRENDTVYFTMGYINGETLKTYTSVKGNITEGQAMSIYKCMTNALLITHSMNILHRDISPDNIMLGSDGTIKLIDFGAARQVIAEESNSLSVILKQGFAPLEQYQRKGRQGPWTDIYALGATIYTSLTGDFLDDPMSRMEDDSEAENNVHGISEGLWRIIRKSTMLKIEDRYQNIFELKQDLSMVKIKEEPFEDIGIPKSIEEAYTDAADASGDAAEADPNATVLLSSRSGTEASSNETVLIVQDPVEMQGEVSVREEEPVQEPEPEPQPEPEPEPQPQPEPEPEPEPVQEADQFQYQQELPEDDTAMRAFDEETSQGAEDVIDTEEAKEVKSEKGSIPRILFIVPVIIIVLLIAIIIEFQKGGHAKEEQMAGTPNERTMMGDAAGILKNDGVDGSIVELTVKTDDVNEKYGVYTAECDVKVHSANNGNDTIYEVTLIYDNEEGGWVLSELSHQ